ncbi:MAG TPA: hypothetical protein VMP11_16495 [Verrucomicrobiae bacterium]|nr:hypothetical protein [Verrucomicrobiae bacterium]
MSLTFAKAAEGVATTRLKGRGSRVIAFANTLFQKQILSREELAGKMAKVETLRTKGNGD